MREGVGVEVKRIRFERLFSLGNYEHVKIGFEADIAENEVLSSCFNALEKKAAEEFQGMVKKIEEKQKKEQEESDLYYKVLNNPEVLKKLKEYNQIPF